MYFNYSTEVNIWMQLHVNFKATFTVNTIAKLQVFLRFKTSNLILYEASKIIYQPI